MNASDLGLSTVVIVVVLAVLYAIKRHFWPVDPPPPKGSDEDPE